MMIHFATDHAGFDLKETLLAFVRDELGHEVNDHGAYHLDSGDDYPDFIKPAAEAVQNNSGDRAIIMGGSGNGEAMCANRYKGVRASVYYGGNLDIVTATREDNDSNILSLGARFLSEDEAKEVVKLWLETDFSDEERHRRRLDKIDSI